MSSSSPPEVQPVRMLADYHQNPSKRYVHVMCIISHLLSLSHLETAVILLQHCSKESYVYYIYLTVSTVCVAGHPYTPWKELNGSSAARTHSIANPASYTGYCNNQGLHGMHCT